MACDPDLADRVRAAVTAAHLAWTGEDMTLTRWDGDRGLRGPGPRWQE